MDARSAVPPLDRSCGRLHQDHPAVVSDTTPEDGYFKREIRISLYCVREGLARLRAQRMERLEVGVKVDGVEQKFPITVLLEPSTAS